VSDKEIIGNAALLLQNSAGIIRNYDELYRKTGLKYNIFKIVRIKEDEVKICRVIADLLNPKGSHYKGDLYLKLFWSLLSSKYKNLPQLDTLKANVITEYYTDEQRRIDIVLEDGTVFIPIEVKINAGEQPDQLKDYAEYAKKKNGKNIPVIFLSLEGREAGTAGDNDYVSVSFSRDILKWLSLCLRQEETEKTPPVREIIKQLIEAVRSITGYSEDEKMSKAISELILQSDESIKAAVEISNALEIIDEGKWNIFKGGILDKVKARFPGAYEYEGGGWEGITVPLKNETYWLYVNYDWAKITIEPGIKKIFSNTGEIITKVMKDETGILESVNDKGVWLAEDTRYPGMEHIDENLYPYLLYKKYKENPDEAANYIISMASKLDKEI